MKQNFGFNQLMLCSALPWFHSDFVINVLHCIFLLFCVLVFVSFSLMLGSSFRSRSFQSLLLVHLRWVFVHFRRCSDVASFINQTNSQFSTKPDHNFDLKLAKITSAMNNYIDQSLRTCDMFLKCASDIFTFFNRIIFVRSVCVLF